METPRIGQAGATVAANVRARRTDLGLSLAELAAKLADLGRTALRVPALSKIENGHRAVTVDDLAALAAALLTTPADLLSTED